MLVQHLQHFQQKSPRKEYSKNLQIPTNTNKSINKDNNENEDEDEEKEDDEDDGEDENEERMVYS